MKLAILLTFFLIGAILGYTFFNGATPTGAAVCQIENDICECNETTCNCGEQTMPASYCTTQSLNNNFNE